MLLKTKLFTPPLRPDLVSRSRLLDQLDQGLPFGHKLTLISAPAGFGKTTLVSQWIVRGKRSAAWLSLDENDSDPTRFLTYLVAALQTVVQDIGEGALALLQSPQPAPSESILTALLNEIAALPENLVLVLDDYHVIDAREVDHALAFLVEHLSPQLHLIVTTREDPHLPLARLRARGQLTELRAADLRFTAAEAAGFFNQMMGLNLSEAEIVALERRTEGWIAGLQLAALSMRRGTDIAGFIRAFAGDNRYIVDYLVEEVLQHQPDQVRRFLLQTSILDRLNGSLCDEVTSRKDGDALLQALERGNLFVVPLDDRRHWYRYHHLFADVLQARLLEEQPEQVPILHRRASQWCQQNGYMADAVRHALAAGAYGRAADLIELAWPAMDKNRQSATWLGWVRALPEAVLRARPLLSLYYAWALLTIGELEKGEARLRDVERWLPATPDRDGLFKALSDGMVVVDEARLESMPESAATARAYHAQAVGDAAGTVKYAQRALDLVPEEDLLRRGRPAAILGMAQWANGDVEAADRTLAGAMTSVQMAGNVEFAITGTYVLAVIKTILGRLNEAVATSEQNLHLAAEHDKLSFPGIADIHVGLSQIFLARGDVKAAFRHLQRSEESGELATSRYCQYRSCLAHAQIKRVQGDLDGAVALLDEAETHFVRGPVPDIYPLAALKARLWLAQGRLDGALAWAREQELSVDDHLNYLQEFEHIILARIHIAQFRNRRADHPIQETIGLLQRLLEAAEAGGRMGVVIEILALLALAHQAEGDVSTALPPLERALTLAEPEEYVQVFVDEGPPMAELLTRITDEGGRKKQYIHKLLVAFEDQKDIHPSRPTPDKSSSLIPQPLIEPLSERELEVLGLVAQGLSNRQISERLYLALSTVKGHNRNIYAKLGVRRRTEAVALSRELGLL